MSRVVRKQLFTVSKTIYLLCFLLTSIPSVSISSPQNRPKNGNAFRSCGEREPMFKNDFVKLVADERIVYYKAEDAFEAMVDLSLDLRPNSKILNPKGSKSINSPNIGGTAIPDGLETFILSENGSGKVIGKWQNSVIFEMKTTASKPITLDDTNSQVAKYLDYLSNSSPASSSLGTGDYNPIPMLIFVTLADTEISEGIKQRATNPREVAIYKTNDKRRRVAVWQHFACKPTEIEKLFGFGADIVVGDGILLNPEVKELDGFRSQTLYSEPGKPVSVPQVFKVKSNKEIIDFTTLIQNPREDLAGGIVPPPSCFDSSVYPDNTFPCSASAAPIGTDEVSKISWGFGIGSDYLL